MGPIVTVLLQIEEAAAIAGIQNLPEEGGPRPYVEGKPRLDVPLSRIVGGVAVPVSAKRIERTLLPVLAVARLEPVDTVIGKRFTDQIEQVTYSFAKALGLLLSSVELILTRWQRVRA